MISDLRTCLFAIRAAAAHSSGNTIPFCLSQVDTDDGSSFLTVEYNVLTYGDNGLKVAFGGRNVVHRSNLYLFVGTCYDFQAFRGLTSSFEHNTCIFRTRYASTCGLSANFGHVVGRNAVFSRNGSLEVCGLPFREWQGQGHDQETTLGKWPHTAEIIKRVNALLKEPLETVVTNGS